MVSINCFNLSIQLAKTRAIVSGVGIEGVKKVTAHPISPYGKDSNNLLMSVYVVFPFMLDDIFKSSHPIEEDGLQLI
jgi:hypothetical protein